MACSRWSTRSLRTAMVPVEVLPMSLASLGRAGRPAGVARSPSCGSLGDPRGVGTIRPADSASGPAVQSRRRVPRGTRSSSGALRSVAVTRLGLVSETGPDDAEDLVEVADRRASLWSDIGSSRCRTSVVALDLGTSRSTPSVPPGVPGRPRAPWPSAGRGAASPAATERSVTAAQPGSASSSMSPLQASDPSPPVAGCRPARDSPATGAPRRPRRRAPRGRSPTTTAGRWRGPRGSGP